MTVVKTTISMTPELYSALTRAALRKDSSISRQIEIYLRENPSLRKYLQEVEAEPKVGPQIAHSKVSGIARVRARAEVVSS